MTGEMNRKLASDVDELSVYAEQALKDETTQYFPVELELKTAVKLYAFIGFDSGFRLHFNDSDTIGRHGMDVVQRLRDSFNGTPIEGCPIVVDFCYRDVDSLGKLILECSGSYGSPVVLAFNEAFVKAGGKDNESLRLEAERLSV